jgi:hypothetical protein
MIFVVSVREAFPVHDLVRMSVLAGFSSLKHDERVYDYGFALVEEMMLLTRMKASVSF